MLADLHATLAQPMRLSRMQHAFKFSTTLCCSDLLSALVSTVTAIPRMRDLFSTGSDPAAARSLTSAGLCVSFH